MMKNFLSDKGFSLIEVLLAVCILATGTLGILRAYAKALDALSAGEMTITAVGLLKNKMADLEEKAITDKGFVAEVAGGELSRDSGFSKWEIVPVSVNRGIVSEVTLLVYPEDDSRKYSLTTYFDVP